MSITALNTDQGALHFFLTVSQIIEPRYTSNTTCSNFRGIQDQFYYFPCTCGYKLHLRQITIAPYGSIVLLSPKMFREVTHSKIQGIT